MYSACFSSLSLFCFVLQPRDFSFLLRKKMIPSIPSKKIHTTNKHSNTHTPFLLLQISVLFYLRANEKRKFFSLSNCRVLGFCFYVFFYTAHALLHDVFAIQYSILIPYKLLVLTASVSAPLSSSSVSFVSVPFYRFTFCCYSIRDL